MSASLVHIFRQGKVLRAMAGAALPAFGGRPALPPLPGPWLEQELAPRAPSLVHDYVRHVGGDPAWYRGTLPAHLFPQWGFPLAARILARTPHPLLRVINAGCRVEVRAPLPASERLLVRARLESAEADERRAKMALRIETGTRSAPAAHVAEMRVYVPLGKGPGGKKGGDVATIPEGAREIARQRLSASSGRDFAILTGDVNPIHWVSLYAKAAGFQGCIAHGFSTFARAIEAVNRAVLSGDVTRLASAEGRFTKPLTLPADVGVYVTEARDLFVGGGKGGAANLVASYELRS